MIAQRHSQKKSQLPLSSAASDRPAESAARRCGVRRVTRAHTRPQMWRVANKIKIKIKNVSQHFIAWKWATLNKRTVQNSKTFWNIFVRLQ